MGVDERHTPGCEKSLSRPETLPMPGIEGPQHPKGLDGKLQSVQEMRATETLRPVSCRFPAPSEGIHFSLRKNAAKDALQRGLKYTKINAFGQSAKCCIAPRGQRCVTLRLRFKLSF